MSVNPALQVKWWTGLLADDIGSLNEGISWAPRRQVIFKMIGISVNLQPKHSLDQLNVWLVIQLPL